MTAKTQFETEIVKRYKNGESSYQISKSDGCSYNTILRELKRRGVNTGLRFWTKKEMERLKEIFPITSKKELLKEFPNRTQTAILAIIRKLGLRKKEYKKTCKGCDKEFAIKYKHERELCLRCIKKQWEYRNLENGRKRKKQWLQKNPEYKKQYTKLPENRERINRYFRQLRKENPQFRLDQNMAAHIYHSLKGKKSGRKWEKLVGYTLTDLIKHLEEQFDDRMNWKNYGGYWHVDHIQPRSLFKYTFSEDSEFRKCWALENLQPLEKITNLRKGNTSIS